jgi:two-component system, chemotaxis family, chemotaxis protein CheY
MERILIVDDSSIMRDSLKIVLEKAGFSTELCADGIECLNKYKSDNNFSLLITDINMPQMNGIDMISNIRSISNELPIIIISTDYDKNEIKTAKDLKVSAWIVKPFKPEDLINLINKIIAKKY